MEGKQHTLITFFTQFKPSLYRRKERIIRPDDQNQNIFFIKQGYIRQYTISKDGIELTIHIFPPMSLFPILWTKDKTNQYYFESLTPVEVYRTPKDNLDRFTKDNPQLILEIQRQLTLFSAGLIKKFEYRVFGNAYQQVIATILDLARIFSKKGSEHTINYWFTHQDLASLSGLSRERVSLEMKKLISKKLITYNKHFMVIKNAKLLEEQL